MGGEGRGEGGVSGLAEVGFAVRDGKTRLAHLYEKAPLRVLFPSPEEGDAALAVLVTTSGGLVAGDRIDITVEVGNGDQQCRQIGWIRRHGTLLLRGWLRITTRLGTSRLPEM